MYCLFQLHKLLERWRRKAKLFTMTSLEHFDLDNFWVEVAKFLDKFCFEYYSEASSFSLALLQVSMEAVMEEEEG